MKTIVLKPEHAIADLNRDSISITYSSVSTTLIKTCIINSRGISTGLELKKYNMRDGHGR